MKRRLGYTLLEMMLTLALSSILVGGLGVTVSRMFTANGTARDPLHTMNNLGRLAEQFRRDAHEAKNAQIKSAVNEAGKDELTFQLDDDIEPGKDKAPGKTVVYSLMPGGVERREFSGSTSLRNELFLLSGLAPLAWTLDEEHREVSLQIGRLANSATAEASTAGQFSILAVMKNANLPSVQ